MLNDATYNQTFAIAAALGNIIVLGVEVHELGRERLTAIFWAVVRSEGLKPKLSRIDVNAPIAQASEPYVPHPEFPVDITDASSSPIELSELGRGTVVRRVTLG